MRRVIIVDDNIYVCRGLRDTVNWASYDMQVIGIYESAEQAIGSLTSSSLDVAFVDIQLPGISGLQFARHLRSLSPNIIIVIISAYAEFSFARECIQIGITRYLLKPIDSEELNNLLAQISATLDSNEYRLLQQQQNASALSELQAIVADEYVSSLAKQLAAANISGVRDVLLKLGAVFESSPQLFWERIASFLNVSDVVLFQNMHLSPAAAQVAQAILDKYRFDMNNSACQAMKRATHYIDENYSQDLHLNTLAEMFAFTPTYFSASFKQYIGRTFTEYLIDKRMAAARDLLKNGLAAKQAALMVGYQNYKSFYKTYKTTFGCPPVGKKDKQP
jgi:two-component system, response regulator YesN